MGYGGLLIGFLSEIIAANRPPSIKYLLILAWGSCQTCQQQKFLAAAYGEGPESGL